MRGAVVIAAGASSRMRAPKALTPVAGQPAVTRICRILHDAKVEDVAVVLGADASSIEAAVPLPARVVRHDGWARGRSSSIKAGIAALPAGLPVLVWPVDHPAVRASTVRALVSSKGAIRVPVYQGKRGHPAWFEAALRDELLALGDDEPLHNVIHRAPERVREVPVDDPGILWNVDSPDDLKKIERLQRQSDARPPA